MKVLTDLPLHAELVSRCASPACCQPLPAAELLGMVAKATRRMADLLNQTARNFPDYTLHDEKHALRVGYVMGRLLPADVLGRLSVLDIALLILSAYAHDLGMALTEAQAAEKKKTREYQDFLVRNQDRWLEAQRALEAKDGPLHGHLERSLFRDFLRERHHLFSAEVVREQFADDLTVDEKPLAEAVALLAQSHGEPVDWVGRLESFPFAGRFEADLPFLACVLRLADYLDLDPARAPRSLMDLLRLDGTDPARQESRRHWHLHQVNSFVVTDRRIKFQAKFKEFLEHKAMKDLLGGLERERRDCMELLRARPGDGPRLALDGRVEATLTPVGYLFEEFQFQLEYREIMSLLMGTQLYRDERVFVRELLQNALDACRYAQVGAARANGRIVVRRYLTPDGREVVEVSDNGSGMTRAIIRDYFMRVGRSYYQSFEFRRRRAKFDAVSQFGIGVLSCFMVSDYVEVETRPDPHVHDGAAGSGEAALRLEIRGPHEYFVVREIERPAFGTTVRVFLRRPLMESLPGIVSRYVGRVPYTVEVRDHGADPLELSPQPFDFAGPTFDGVFTALPGSFGYKSEDLVFDGERGFGLHGRVRLFMLEASSRRHLRLRNAGKYSFVGFSKRGDTLAAAEQLTADARQKLDQSLNQVRVLAGQFPPDSQKDLDGVLRHFGRLCDDLAHRHDTGEVQTMWSAVNAQIEAAKVSAAFRSHPGSGRVAELLSRAVTELQAFVKGELQLATPQGILTQDGIHLDFLDLPARLNLRIGYLYNLDLCGEYRVSLNAARDGVLYDDRTNRLFLHLQQRVGEFLGTWFSAEGVPPDEVAEYRKEVDTPLAGAVGRTYSPQKGIQKGRRG